MWRTHSCSHQRAPRRHSWRRTGACATSTMADTMSKPLHGRVALITGASRGLGKAMALELGAAGAALALVGRDQVKLDETASEAAAQGADAAVFVADIAQEAHVLA